MILIETGKERVPNVHTAPHTLVHIVCENYGFINHEFRDGSDTTIEWSQRGVVYFKDCVVHAGATITVSGYRLQIDDGTVFHQGGKYVWSCVEFGLFYKNSH